MAPQLDAAKYNTIDIAAKAAPLLRQMAMRIVGKEMAMMSPDAMRTVLSYALQLVEQLSGSEAA